MSVEKIDASKSVQVTPIIEKQIEKEESTVPKTSGSNKDVVTVLSVLAAIGAAGVAIYEHKNTKKMVKEAEEKAKKKIEEAEEKAKKAAEDVEKKIQEAVEKIKNEYEKTDKTPETTKSTPKKNTSKTRKYVEDIRNKFKRTSRKTEKPSVQSKPKTQENNTPAVLEGGIKENELEVVDEHLAESINNSKNGVIVVPVSTKITNYIKDKVNAIKNRFQSYRKKFNRVIVEEPIVQPKPKTPENNTPAVLEGGIKENELEVVDEHLAESINNSKNGVIVVPVSTKITNYIKDKVNAIKSRFQSYRKKFNRVIVEEPTVQQKHVKTKEEIKAEINKAKKELEKIQSREDKILRTATDEELIEIYNILKDKVAQKTVDDIDSQIFLSVKGELFNHRGYSFTGKEQNPIKKESNALKQKFEQQLSTKTDYAKQSEIYVNKPHTEEEHNAIQALYDKLAEEEQQKAVYSFKGIKIPDVKNISEQNLITEYNALKNIVKNREVADPAAIRFLEIQGELINHRGYYFNNYGELTKEAAKEVEPQVNQGAERFFDNGAKKGLKEIQKAEFAERHEKIASHSANKKWLKEQHDMKEQEYQKLFDEHFAQKEKEQFAEDAAKGLRQIELEQDGKRYSQLASEAKNANWLKEQHDIKEQEYQKLFDEHFAQKEKEKFLGEDATEGVKILDAEKQAAKDAKLESEIRNEAYLKEQHDMKEQEYQKLFDEHFAQKEKEKFLGEDATEGVKILDAEKQAAKDAKLASETKNQAYIEEQTDKKEQEYQKLFDKNFEEQGRTIVANLEKKLDGRGNLVVDIPRKHNKRYHNKLQKEYDKLAVNQFASGKTDQEKIDVLIENAKRCSGIMTDKLTYTAKLKNQLSIKPIRTFQDTDSGVEITRNVVRGLNELPESFNETERNLVKNVYRHTDVPAEKVTEYPRLYAGKEERKAAIKGLFSEGFPSFAKLKDFVRIMGEEKAAKKAYKKAKKEHIARRAEDYKKHNGIGNAEVATSNTYMITKDMKYSYRKYASMSKERPTEKDWEVEMTREEFMKNKEQYMAENFEREYKTHIKHRHS